jgi:prefoldin subunit 5
VFTNNDSLLQRVQSSYQRLTAVASNLNSVSDDLGRAIRALDESLKKLNLGVTTWHKFASDDGGESQDYWGKYIGYARVGGRWGISLSKTSGNYSAPPEYHTEEEWLFNDAPREFRLEAVEHIPAMIESLIKAGEEAVEKVRVKTSEARQLAEGLTSAAKPAQSAPRNVKSKLENGDEL